MQKQAKDIKKKLANIHIEAEVDGLVVTMNGEQVVINIEIKNDELLQDKDRLQKALIEATNKAIKKSQEVAAENMKDLMSSLGLGQ